MSQPNGRPLLRIQQAMHERIPNEQERDVYREIAVCGRSVKDVAATRKLAEPQIQGMVDRVRRWLAQMPSPIDIRVLHMQHLARLEHQWQEAMNAWYRSSSKDETIKSSYEDQKKKAAPAEEGKRKVERTTREPCGDVRYLEQARKIMAEYRALSTEAAALVKKEKSDANPDTLAQLDEEAAQAVAAIRERKRKEKDS